MCPSFNLTTNNILYYEYIKHKNVINKTDATCIKGVTSPFCQLYSNTYYALFRSSDSLQFLTDFN